MRPEDEEGIHAVFARAPMRLGTLELLYDRRPSFEKLLALQAPRWLTLVGGGRGEVKGFASFSWGTRYVDGVETSAVYAGDFRLCPDRALARTWRALYPELLRLFARSTEFGRTTWIYTAVLEQNLPALRSLVESREKNAFFYHPLARLAMVNSVPHLPRLSRLPRPWGRANPPMAGIRVVRGDALGEARLVRFLDEANRALFLGYPFASGEWTRRKENWPGYGAETFFVLLDPAGEPLACGLPWSPGRAKKLLVSQADPVSRFVFGAVGMLGTPVPRVGQPIETLYLSHLCFRPGLSEGEKPDLLRQLLDAVEKSGVSRGCHLVSYADPNGWREHPALRGSLGQVTRVGLFLVTPTPVHPRPEGLGPVGFEMGLV
jgi:hypothetical protein